MTNNFVLEIVTPARKVINKEVNSVVLPTANGYMGILVNHAPLISSLGLGILKYKSDGKEEHVAIYEGFMEVSKNKLSIMADDAECAAEIDVERAKQAEERAREKLKKRDDLDVLQAEIALRKAIIRLRTARLG